MDYTQHLARIKLRETARQRDRLRQEYDAIEARVAAAGSPLDRLRALHEGLRALVFAQKRLHPEVGDLDALFLADNLGTVPPELVADRTRFLERELAQGRLRADFTYAFGRILSEWLDRKSGPPPRPEGDPFAILWEAAPELDAAWLAELFASLDAVLRPVRQAVAAFDRDQIQRPAQQHEVAQLLRYLARHPNLSPELRRQAASAGASATQTTELAGVLTILLNGLDDWQWPDEGVPLRSVWARVKYRPFLDEDLITALFLELVGRRWTRRLGELLPWSRLREGKEPFVRPEPPTSPEAAVAELRLRAQEKRLFSAVGMTTGLGATFEGSAGYQPYALLEQLLTVESEIRFRRACYPDRPLYVLQGDLRDFYPSLSRDLMLEALRQLGFPDRWVAFAGRFLTPTVRHQGESRRVRRGLLLEHTLSDLLAECVLWFLDAHVYRKTGTLLVRVVDDFFAFTNDAGQARAVWAAVQDFCRATQLAVNEAKSGSVVLGADLPTPEGLPAGLPRWGLLRLQPDATWAIDEPALAQVQETMRREAEASPSVLALVANYNGYAQYLRSQLALPVTLPGDHLRRAGQRLQHLHDNLFGPGHGLVEEIDRRLRDSDARHQGRALPHALLYWPITAGGLALAHPLLHVAGYLDGRRRWEPPRVPDREAVAAFLFRRRADARKQPLDESRETLPLARNDPDRPGAFVSRTHIEEYQAARAVGTDEELPEEAEIDAALASLWGRFYNAAVATLEPANPPPLPAMEQLVADFIARGREVSGHAQASLSPYWRWVVYAYGPSLLEALGTFRFLLTELVPLQLILENRGLTVGDGATPEPSQPPRPIPLPPADDAIPF